MSAYPPPGDAPRQDQAPPPNPYMERATAPPPDLDAGAPHLHTAEAQRLNRKALVFLAGIILLLGAFALWLFSAEGPASQDPRARPQAEQIVIPEAPRDLPALPEPRPAAPELPPLPVIEDERAGNTGPAMPALSDEHLPGGQFLSLLERRMQDASAAAAGFADAAHGGQDGLGPAGAGMPEHAALARSPATGPTSAQPLYRPDTLLLRGTYIRCILQSRLVSDFPGYTSCIVTEPVYSVNGRRLLLPRGSRVMGYYNSDATIGDRAAIVWDRITTPAGVDINMVSPGVDALGAAGNEGHYSAHWGQRITSALLISLLSDAFKYVGAKNGPSQVTQGNGFVVQSPYESNTARTLERLAGLAVERNMSRPPTVTLNQGTLLNVYVARDVDFSAVMP